MADLVHDEEERDIREGDDSDENNEEEDDIPRDGEGAENDVVEEYVVREEELEELRAGEGEGEGEEDDDEEDDDEGEEEDDDEEEEEMTEDKPLDKNVCRHCHQPGHKERKCPVLHPELVKAPRMKPKRNTTELEIRQRVCV